MSTFHDLARLLSMNRLTHVVDIGANPIEGVPSYRPLLDAQLCRVTGFEPQASALAEVNLKKGANETYFPYAVGDGREHTLNLCAYSGWTSIFVPSAAALEAFSFFKNNARVVGQTQVQTRRLDDLVEVDDIDFLKIDIQRRRAGRLRAWQRKAKECRGDPNGIAICEPLRRAAVFWSGRSGAADSRVYSPCLCRT